MSKLITPSSARVLAGLLTVSAFAVAPVAAQAADSTVSGTLTAGGLTNTAPNFGSISTTLNGDAQTIDTTVGAWNVIDATGSNAGYSLTVSATAPADSGGTAGTGGGIVLTPATATAGGGNQAPDGPISGGATTVDTAGETIANAAATTGQGEWDFAADAGAAKSLAVTIPADASAGTYSSTLSFTTAPPVG